MIRVLASSGLTLLLLCFHFAPACAQVAKGEYRLGGLVSVGIPSGDLDEAADPGRGLGGFFEFMLVDQLAVGVEMVSIDFEEVLITGEDSELLLAVDALRYGGYARLFMDPESTVNLFVSGGFSFTKFTTDASLTTIDRFGVLITDATSGEDTQFAYRAGVGAFLAMGEDLNAVIEGSFHQLSDREISAEGEIRATRYFELLGGVAIRF